MFGLASPKNSLEKFAPSSRTSRRPVTTLPSKFWIATFSIDNKKVLLSIVDHPQAGCQGSGIRHDTLPHELSCPTRLTIIEGNKYITSDAGLTCFYRDNTFATYDEKARSLHIFSTVDGKPASDCENNIHFPEGATQ